MRVCALLNVFLGDPYFWHICGHFVVEKYVHSKHMYIITRLNVLIEPKQYLVIIRFLIFLSNFTFWDVASFCQLLFSNINVKNDIFELCLHSVRIQPIAWMRQMHPYSHAPLLNLGLEFQYHQYRWLDFLGLLQ